MAALPDQKTLQKEVDAILASAKSLDEVEQARVQLLGRKGVITQALRALGTATTDQKKTYGPVYNSLKNTLEAKLAALEQNLSRAQRNETLERDRFDITLPGMPYRYGHTHPISQVLESLVAIFRSLGFVCADGPEIESEYFNFEALNIPADHPARDMQDTFYLTPGSAAHGLRQDNLPFVPAIKASSLEPNLLRTHTSPVQVRILQQYPPPVSIVVPGRVYRHEALDATHSSIFHQLEGLLVDQGVSFADLKGVLNRFAQAFFGPAVKTRFRPSFFPFTEPSAEMDISCLLCEGSGCRVCKGNGWLEMLGAGMVHPNVLTMSRVDPEKFTGFAFGMGIERLAMFKYGINDIRLFFENDARFLEQF